MKPWRIRLLLCLVTVVALDQFVQLALLDDGYVRSRRIAPFDPPIFAPIQSESLARIRSHLNTGQPPLSALDFDAELGWRPKPDSGSHWYQHDWAGCRIGNGPLPRERTLGRRRAVAVGCSFTFGSEVDARDTWEAQLERLARELEVANLGVGGYGMDQALLRWRRDGIPLHPDEVWFEALPSAMLRVVTTYMPALSHWGFGASFKPRFELEHDGGLHFVPSPARNLDDVVRLMSSQSEFVAAVGHTDRWVMSHPAAYAPFGSSWLHRSSIARVVLTLDEKHERDVSDELRNPASEIFQLTQRVCRMARADAQAAGARFRIWLFPTRGELQSLDEGAAAYWTSWVEALRQDGFEVFDLTPAFQAAGGARNAGLWAPETHYSAEGNGVVARALADYLAGS